MKKKALLATLALLNACATVTAEPPRGEVGDWTYAQVKADLWLAMTGNDESVFSQMCAKDTCLYLYKPPLNCDVGDTYPSLISADNGAANVELECVQMGDSKYVSLSDFDTVDNIVRGGGILGIAIAVESGDFSVVRFSLTGAGDAIDIMQAHRSKPVKRGAKLGETRL